MSNAVRLGIVGTGSISLRGLLPHLTMEDVQDRVNITAVCDPVPGRAQAAAEKFGVPHAYETYEELLEANGVDAVSIASPIGFHYEQGLMAIEHGVHMHFNKTMTTTVAEADDLIVKANANDVKIVSSPGQMINPLLNRIRELVQEGALGTLTWAVTGSAFGTYHQQESTVRHGDDVLTNVNPAWYFRKPGGGPLYDMTVYGLHSLTGILGPAKRVSAFSGVRLHEREFQGETLQCDMDDNTLITVDFGNALFAMVYGVAAGGIPDSWHPMIFGTEGMIKSGTLNGESIEYPGSDEAAQHRYGPVAMLPHVVGQHREMEEAHVYEDVMQLVDLVRDDIPTVATAEHARHVIEIFDAAYRSAETGQAQELRSTF